MKNIFSYSLGTLILFIGNFFLFQFQNIPNFRDFVGTEYFYHLEYSPNISTWLHYFFNFLSNSGVNMITAHEVLFAGYLTLGFCFIFVGLQKISGIINASNKMGDHKGTPLQNTNLQKIFLIILSFFLVYNPWVLERILMGQLGIFLGYAIMVWNFSLMVEIFHNQYQGDHKGTPLQKINQKILLFSLSLLLSLLVSPHYPILIIGIFSGYSLFHLLKRLKVKYLSSSTHSSFDSAQGPLNIIKNWFIVIIPSFVFLASRYVGESQYSTFSSSEHQVKILENFSLWDDGKNFILESLVGKNSWMSDGFVEKISLAKDLGILKNFSLYFSPLLQLIFCASVFGIIIFVLFEYFHTKNLHSLLGREVKELENKGDHKGTPLPNTNDKKIILFSFILFFSSLIFNFGIAENSGIFREINLLFYDLPFSYIFREAGKFYALSLLSLGIILIIFWKFLGNIRETRGNSVETRGNFVETRCTVPLPQKIFLGIFLLFTISNFLVFLPLAKNLNQPVYPQIFSELQEECKKNPEKKILYLPLRQYTTSSYSYDVFTLTPDKYLFACSRVDHTITFLGSENIVLNTDSRFSGLQKSIAEFSQKFPKTQQKSPENIILQNQKFLDFQKQIQKLHVDYLIIDTTDTRQNTENFLYNLVKYQKIYKYENNIFIFKVNEPVEG